MSNGDVNGDRRGPLIQGLSRGPAVELEAKLLALRQSPADQVFQPSKRRKLQIRPEDRANVGVKSRDLKDRASIRSAAQREADREAKLLQKAALYEQLQNGQARPSDVAADFLVDFEQLAQKQLDQAPQPERIAASLPNFDAVDFRQQGLLQDEDENVLRTGDAYQSKPRLAAQLFESMEHGPKKGRGGIGLEPNPFIKDELELKIDRINDNIRFLAQGYVDASEEVLARLDPAMREAVDVLQQERSSTDTLINDGKPRKKSKKMVKEPSKPRLPALEKAKAAVLKRQATEAMKKAAPG